mmetsp:Transcript_86292/g.279404  ORF Transcript_86292/g.279404 Transcript_86292/m.279404 type:complete len:283 (-) Transcript_86292:238-1086(-)
MAGLSQQRHVSTMLASAIFLSHFSDFSAAASPPEDASSASACTTRSASSEASEAAWPFSRAPAYTPHSVALSFAIMALVTLALPWNWPCPKPIMSLFRSPRSMPLLGSSTEMVAHSSAGRTCPWPASSSTTTSLDQAAPKKPSVLFGPCEQKVSPWPRRPRASALVCSSASSGLPEHLLAVTSVSFPSLHATFTVSMHVSPALEVDMVLTRMRSPYSAGPRNTTGSKLMPAASAGSTPIALSKWAFHSAKENNFSALVLSSCCGCTETQRSKVSLPETTWQL